MAGMAENIQVVSSETSVVYSPPAEAELSPTDLTFPLGLGADTSLQELIDSELALRIGQQGGPPPPDPPADPNQLFLQIERGHTVATLNVFSDTIDLSPTQDFMPASPMFAQPEAPASPVENDPFEPSSEVARSRDLENIANPEPDDESPVTDPDHSELEPIPLFTQTITSDHESPLTEVNPFGEDFPDLSPDKSPPGFPEDVLVVIDPPDDRPFEGSEDPPEEVTMNLVEIEKIETILEHAETIVPEITESLVEVESPTPSPSPPTDSVDACVSESGSNSMRVQCEPVCSAPDSEWTTVEDAIREVQSCEAVQLFQDHLQETAQELPVHKNSSEMTTTTTTKTVKKKKSIEGSEATSTRTKKTKKTKKSEEKENHISVMTNGHDHDHRTSSEEELERRVSPAPLDDDELSNVCVRDLKSSFSKFDQLQKKSVLHVRSSDTTKIQSKLNQEAPEAQGANPTCKSCNKTVFVMEQVKAERSVWHKNCFRCKECSKQLTVDIYESHDGELYCKPHFKELFKPKAVVENIEDELSSNKADLGLEELSALNVKSRYQVFEKQTESLDVERSPSTVNVKRSPSILSKLAKFQKKGMDVGVTDESLNGVDYEESSSSEDEAQTGEDGKVVKSSKLTERPVSFNKMEDVKRTWETSGSTKTKEDLRAEHKKEISQIRSRLFQGKQGKMKEMYEQAVLESEGKVTTKKDQDIVLSEKARLLKERFERGEIVHSDSEEDEEKKKSKDSEEMSVFEAGISKKSRSIFLELDATAAKIQTSPVSPPVHALTPRATERRTSQTAESPDREVYRDPEVVRGEDTVEDETVVKRSQTASRMLSLFRQMEEQKEAVPDGPKPLKCFTPPPDYKEGQSGGSSEEEDEESEEEEESEDDGIVRSSDKIEDEFLIQARNAAKAKALKEKFEHWEPEKQSVNNAINLLDSEQESIESTKSLRARFESLKAEQPKEKPRPKVNRFVEVPAVSTKCVSCDKTVYPLEKVEVDGKVYHSNCFRCQQCQCKLRMESYTLNNDQLYCLPHFRQLFIAKGNYDEGFGNNQHKRKWEATATATVTAPVLNGH